MNVKLRNFLLKSIPYLLSIAGGVVVFLISVDGVRDAAVTDLMNNIAASLLSIPLVFLLYDYSNYRISRQVNKNLTDNISNKINSVMIDVIMLLRQMLGTRTKLTQDSLNHMLMMSHRTIMSRMKISSKFMDQLRTYRNELDDAVYHATQSGAFPAEHTRILSGIILSMSHMINEEKFHRDRKLQGKYLANIMGGIMDWLDSDAVATLHLSQRLNGDAMAANSGDGK